MHLDYKTGRMKEQWKYGKSKCNPLTEDLALKQKNKNKTNRDKVNPINSNRKYKFEHIKSKFSKLKKQI